MKTLRVLAVLVGTLLAASFARAASLSGETVTLKVHYAVSADTVVDEDLYTTTFVVGGGVEVSGQAISKTFTSGGFPATLSGTVTVDVSGNSMSVNFTGTQQAGGLTFILSSVTDESAAAITATSETSTSGLQSGVNLTIAPTHSTANNGTITTGFAPLGTQPGVNIGQVISFTLADSVIPTPTISNVSPGSGPAAGGTSITITGTGFVAVSGVTIGGTAATSFTVNSSTQITATTPAHAAGTVNVAVTNSTATATDTNAFTYIAAPTVTNVSPTSGPATGGTSLTITGTAFTGATAVTIGGTAATGVVVVNSTTITANAPSHAGGTVSIAVTTPGGTGTGTNLYTYTVPSVSSVSVPADGTYKLGANLDFTVNWSAPVSVSGTPGIALTIGSTGRTATYQSGTGSSALVFRYTVQATDLDSNGIAVGALSGTVTDTGGHAATLTLNSVGSTANVDVDGIVPTLSPVSFVSSNTNTVRARTNDVVTLTFTSSEAISTPTVTIAGHTVTANATGNNWTAAYTMIAGDTEGTIPFSIAFADLATNAGTTVTGTTDATAVTFDRTAPTVTASRIAVTGASGTGGAFRVGDTLTVTWNNTVTGDNNPDVSLVTMNLSALGGGAAVAATNTAGNWSAGFTVVADSIDATNLNAVLALVRDTTGNLTIGVSGTDNVTVDNIPPVVTAANIALSGATGVGGVYKIGDTVTASWNNTAAGDNNADTLSGVTVNFSAFGGGATVAATNTAGTWTATYTIVAGAVQASNLNVSVSVTDDAGNLTTTAGTNNVTVDNVAPAAPSAPDLATADDTGSSSVDNITNVAAPTFTGTAAAGTTVRLFDGVTQVGSAVAAGGTWSIQSSALATGPHTLTATATDASGNASAASGGLVVTIDTTAPVVPVIATISSDTGASSTDAVTSDTTLSVSGTAEAGATITIFRDATLAGTTTADGVTGAWTFDYTGTALTDATYQFTATATDAAGNVSSATANFPVVIDTIAPVVANTAAPGVYNAAFSYQISAPGAVSYTAPGLPGGLLLNATTGVISGTPTAAGSTPVTLSATDLAGNTGTANITIVIAKATPVITWATPAPITYGTALSSTQLNATATVASVTIPGVFVYTPAATTIPAAGSQTLSTAFTPTDTANYNSVPVTTVTLTVDKIALTISGLSAQSRVFDGTTVAGLSGTAALVGVLPADLATVSLSGTAAGAFADRNIGTAKPVTVSGLSLTGAASANYSLTLPTSLTANVTAKTLTVTGVTAANRAYNGTTSATLAFGGAALVGIVSPDVVTLVTGAAVGTFADANAGGNKVVTVTGLTLAGGGNYALTQPTTTATITAANATVTITNLSHTYDGKPKSATVTIQPNATAAIVYSAPGGAAPTNAGSYLVTVNITENNYSGSAVGTLVIAKAAQTVAFNAPTGPLTIAAPIALTATASSGLPVSFSVVSGPATIAGSTLTLTGSTAAVLRATQPGNENYLATSADVTVTAAVKATQTIAFAPLSNRRASDPAFTISATASSGLPVSFAVSGPASFNSATRTVTLTGAPGAVSIVASQTGNDAYQPAANVTQSFNALATGQQVYFGLTRTGDNVVLSVAADGKSGQLLCVLGATNEIFLVSFTINPDGTFTATTIAIADADPEVRAIAEALLGGRVLAASGPLTFTGTIGATSFSGSIVELGLTFSGTAQSASGPSAAVSGEYRAIGVNGTGGTDYFMVGSQGNIFAAAALPGGTVSGLGTLNGSTFTVTAGTATIAGTIDPATTAISGTVTSGGRVVQTFAGMGAFATRTDRLANLSSRVRIAPATGRTLITGFVIAGTASKRVLLRAVGPALAEFGVTGALPNPRLQLFDSTGRVILENDDWSGTETSTAFAQVGAFALATGAKDAALVTTLAPGAYSMQVTSGPDAGVGLAEIYDASASPGTEPQHLVNLSTRGTVDVGTDGLLIGGFVVTGNAPKKILIRGVGPGLAAFGVTGALADPRLSVHGTGGLVAQNDDWSVATPLNAQQTLAGAADIGEAARATGAFALGAASKDAALLLTLAPGAYTAQITGATGQSGVALVEIYEVP